MLSLYVIPAARATAALEPPLRVALRARTFSDRGERHEARLFHHADPSAGQGLADIAARGPRGVPARRQARLRRGLCRRARHRPSGKHHLLRGVHRQPDRRHQDHQARHRHDQHAELASGRRPPSQIAMLDHMLDGRFIFGISPGGLALRRRSVRQSRRRPQRHVPRGDQRGAGNLGARAALQHRRQILEHQDRAAGDAGDRPGLFAEAAADSRIRRSW